jgi:hypothetical protein
MQLKWILGIAAVGAAGWVTWRVVHATQLGLSPRFALTNPGANLAQVKAQNLSPTALQSTRAATTGAGSF